ncbi:hypothetical protein ACFL1M_02870 [Patescibacteria group bacterium]
MPWWGEKKNKPSPVPKKEAPEPVVHNLPLNIKLDDDFATHFEAKPDTVLEIMAIKPQGTPRSFGSGQQQSMEFPQGTDIDNQGSITVITLPSRVQIIHNNSGAGFLETTFYMPEDENLIDTREKPSFRGLEID